MNSTPNFRLRKQTLWFVETWNPFFDFFDLKMSGFSLKFKGFSWKMTKICRKKCHMTHESEICCSKSQEMIYSRVYEAAQLSWRLRKSLRVEMCFFDQNISRNPSFSTSGRKKCGFLGRKLSKKNLKVARSCQNWTKFSGKSSYMLRMIT